MNAYIDFLRYCLDDSLPIPNTVKDINWKAMMSWAGKQTIIGVIYGGIENAGRELR